ncbi:hypothetical protein CLOM_g20428 [Closterium sp. NIES-68]|nr:hypothetical protein CLOM_g20428 [Closterium sp. NIES-68]GJP85498.1 hypothetical protein CLOP_g15590 [Closterium sp. NIES-67]
MAESAGLNKSSSRQLCPGIQLSYPNVVQECYASRSTTGYSVFVIPFNTSCDSFLLLPAEQLWSPAVRSAWYLCGMLYCFVGLAAIVRVFMAALDRIASTHAMVSRHDPKTGREERRVEKVWNSTVVNIALMALGTSAPEIVIAVVDALKRLNQAPGVLGPGTVLGSAAFNLMVISAVCVVTPGRHSIKRIRAVGVFLLELAASTWAYVWILLVLKVFSPGRITIVEACITLLFFPLFILLAYAQDQRWRFCQLWPRWQLWKLPVPFFSRAATPHPRRGSLTRFKSHGSRQALIVPAAAQGSSKHAAAAGDGGYTEGGSAWWDVLWRVAGSGTGDEQGAGGGGGRGGEVKGAGSDGGVGAVWEPQAEVKMQRGAQTGGDGLTGGLQTEGGDGVGVGDGIGVGVGAGAGDRDRAISTSIAMRGTEEVVGEQGAMEGDGRGSHGSWDLSDLEGVGRMGSDEQQRQPKQASEIRPMEPAAADQGRAEAGPRSVALNMPPARPQRSNSSNLRRRSSMGISAAAAAIQHDSPDQSLSRCLGQHLWLRSQLTGLAQSPAPAPAAPPPPRASPVPLSLDQPQQQQQQQEHQQEEQEKAEGHVRGGGAVGDRRVGQVAEDTGAVDLSQEGWTLLARSGERELCRFEHRAASTSGASSSAASSTSSPPQALNFLVYTAEPPHLLLELTIARPPHGTARTNHAGQSSPSDLHAALPPKPSASAASAHLANASTTPTDTSLQSQPPWFTSVAPLTLPSIQSRTRHTSSLLLKSPSAAGSSRGGGTGGCNVEGGMRAVLDVAVQVEGGEGLEVVEVKVTVLSLTCEMPPQQQEYGELLLDGASTYSLSSYSPPKRLGLGEAWLQQIENALSRCRRRGTCHCLTLDSTWSPSTGSSSSHSFPRPPSCVAGQPSCSVSASWPASLSSLTSLQGSSRAHRACISSRLPPSSWLVEHHCLTSSRAELLPDSRPLLM